MKHALAVALVVLALLVPALARAADGTLVVEVAGADGKLLPADVEVRQAGKADLLKKVAALTGEAQTALAAGDYDVTGVTRVGAYRGTQRVKVVAGQVNRFRVTVTTPTKGVTATGSKLAGKGIHGTVTSGAGTTVDGEVRIVIVLRTNKGQFQSADLPPGTYTVEFWQGGTKKATQSATVGSGGGVEVDLKTQ